MHTKLCYTIAIVMGTFALYVGISGWVVADFEARMDRQVTEQKGDVKEVIYRGISFKNVVIARQVIEQDMIMRYFRWVFEVPPGLPLLLTALAFGFVGGIANILHKLAGSERVPGPMLLFKPLYGGIIGLMVFGISTTAPKLIVESAEGVRPLALMFLCLFAGTFANHVYTWVEEKTKLLFPLSNPAAPGTPAPPVPPAPPFPPPAPGGGPAPTVPASRFDPPQP